MQSLPLVFEYDEADLAASPYHRHRDVKSMVNKDPARRVTPGERNAYRAAHIFMLLLLLYSYHGVRGRGGGGLCAVWFVVSAGNDFGFGGAVLLSCRVFCPFLLFCHVYFGTGEVYSLSQGRLSSALHGVSVSPL